MKRTMQFREQEPPTAVPDCIAFCAPGAALSVRLLIERILLKVTPDPANQGQFTLSSEELYDCLIRPERQAISKILFVSPHILFRRSDLHHSLSDQVRTLGFEGRTEEDWHLPLGVELTGTNANIRLHGTALSFKTGASQLKQTAFQSFPGTIIQPKVGIPDQLCSKQALDVLSGLGRSVFECYFDRPIEIGESVFVRLSIKPIHLIPPVPIRLPGDGSGLPTYSQTLDILGPDTMIQSFRDLVQNMRDLPQLPESLAEKLNDTDIQMGLDAVADYVFKNGFDLPGTYTRIEDQRIVLTSTECRINRIGEQGRVTFEAIAPVTIRGQQTHVFHWYSGMADFWYLDPVLATESLYQYASEFTSAVGMAKSKAYFTCATGIDYLLVCEIIDELMKRQLLMRVDRNGEAEYYAPPSPSLGKTDLEKRDLLASIAVTITRRLQLPRGQFRILFEAIWGPKSAKRRNPGSEVAGFHHNL